MNDKLSIKRLKEHDIQSKRDDILIFLILFAVIIILSVLMMTVGNTYYSLSKVFSIIRSGSLKGPGYTINKLRVPKLIIGGLRGFAFGVSGYTFQTLLRNNLASPDIIGVTSGSSVGAVFCILILHMSGITVSVVSIICGLRVTLSIFFLSGSKGHRSDSKMILCGIGIQAMCNSLISWMLLIGSEFDVGTALRWMRGSLNNAKREDIPFLLVFVFIAFVILLYLRKDMRMLQLGEEYPRTLGVSIKNVKLRCMISALVLSSVSTRITGPISSVAFLSGPLALQIRGKGKDTMVFSGMVGMILVYRSELVGQNLLPARYPVGVITGLLGAPYLLYLLMRMNRERI